MKILTGMLMNTMDINKTTIKKQLGISIKEDMTGHQKTVYSMMCDALCGGKEVWVHFDDALLDDRNEEVNNQKATLMISILTDKMLNYDSSILNEGKRYIQEKKYRPYFMFFVSSLEKDACEKYNERIGTWAVANFSDNNENSNGLSGYVEFAASPVRYSPLERTLIIEDDELDPDIVEEINRTYIIPPILDDRSIQRHLKNELANVQIDFAKIYKVGNGNCIYLNGSKRVLFDIGFNQRSGEAFILPQYANARRAISNIRPDDVIISHWDVDHYIAVVYARNDVFEKPWFVPQIVDSDTVGVRRLAAYINILSGGKLYQIRRRDRSDFEVLATVNKKSSRNRIIVCRGEGNLITDKNERNCNGIGILVLNRKVKALFQADIPYDNLTEFLWRKDASYDYLVVPHHGAYEDTYNLDKSKNIKGIAIVSGDGGSNRPNASSRMALETKGYDVYITENANAYYIIDLKHKRQICDR